MIDEDEDVVGHMMPKLNRWGGWFGRRASPGDVRVAWVGEILGKDVDRRWPPLFWGRTGGFLIRSIGLDLWPLGYYTNAVKPPWANSDLYKEICEHVVPERVVALGGEASRILTLHHVEHVKLPHPSWVLRFHYTEREAYAALYRKEMLREGDQRQHRQVRSGGVR